ncbi:adenylate kinase family protein [Aeropyrum camini]|uniref:Predicted nucleotide kinase n=1 Tax=Aeropyrum camini SY1 = JCM 12091 TaxID=1198449 RepID=U3TEB3_9CREN|nr:adenylate kinase family protein [Aeropyrum camini]BAN90781.1 predicted nucleotide kinase [Aeropyrum camini SY1 = JCM 12091]
MLILVTGTPGTGKTSVGRLIARETGCRFVESSPLLEALGATSRDPTGRATLMVEWSAAVDRLRSLDIGCWVVSTVTPSLWLESLGLEVALVVLLRTNPLLLEERLEARGWPRGKVVENVVAEAFGEIAWELVEYGFESATIEVDTSLRSPRDVAREVFDRAERWDTGISIDWFESVEVASRVAELLGRGYLSEYRVS